MATFDYSGITSTALSLITQFGTTFTISRTADGGNWTEKFNAATQRKYWEDSGSNIVYVPPTGTIYTYTGVCVITNFMDEEIDGTLIKRGDKKLVAKIETVVPRQNDLITVASTSYEYVNHKSVAPDGNSIIYLIQI